MKTVTADCPAEEMQAEDPLLFSILLGQRVNPRACCIRRGYLVYAAMTHHYVFDYRDGEIYWCTADVGWITGHSYILYGPRQWGNQLNV